MMEWGGGGGARSVRIDEQHEKYLASSLASEKPIGSLEKGTVNRHKCETCKKWQSPGATVVPTIPKYRRGHEQAANSRKKNKIIAIVSSSRRNVRTVRGIDVAQDQVGHETDLDRKQGGSIADDKAASAKRPTAAGPLKAADNRLYDP